MVQGRAAADAAQGEESADQGDQIAAGPDGDDGQQVFLRVQDAEDQQEILRKIRQLVGDGRGRVPGDGGDTHRGQGGGGGQGQHRLGLLVQRGDLPGVELRRGETPRAQQTGERAHQDEQADGEDTFQKIVVHGETSRVKNRAFDSVRRQGQYSTARPNCQAGMLDKGRAVRPFPGNGRPPARFTCAGGLAWFCFARQPQRRMVG